MDDFIQPADLFKKRRVSGVSVNNKPVSSFLSGGKKSNLIAQSPMKCLNNLTDPSPTKKLPTVLRNPFNQPIKRRLQLGGIVQSDNEENEELGIVDDDNETSQSFLETIGVWSDLEVKPVTLNEVSNSSKASRDDGLSKKSSDLVNVAKLEAAIDGDYQKAINVTNNRFRKYARHDAQSLSIFQLVYTYITQVRDSLKTRLASAKLDADTSEISKHVADQMFEAATRETSQVAASINQVYFDVVRTYGDNDYKRDSLLDILTPFRAASAALLARRIRQSYEIDSINI